MNERQEKTSDILGKLTVLGTIVLPMNVVTGIWGMNCEFSLFLFSSFFFRPPFVFLC